MKYDGFAQACFTFDTISNRNEYYLPKIMISYGMVNLGRLKYVCVQTKILYFEFFQYFMAFLLSKRSIFGRLFPEIKAKTNQAHLEST